MQRLSILSFLLILTAACKDNSGQAIVKYVDSDPVFFDYKIWGEEDRNYVTVMLQFRVNDETGNTRCLRGASSASLDGQVLTADSSKMSGYFYELQQALDSFSGTHVIAFKDSLGRVFQEQFEFSPFSIATEIPSRVHRKDLEIQLQGLKSKDYIRVIALDTAFRSRGINEVDTVYDGLLRIPVHRLDNLVNGRIHLELYREEERPVKKSTSSGGYISITYGLKRGFELVD